MMCAVLACLRHEGGDLVMGPPPRSALERLAQRTTPARPAVGVGVAGGAQSDQSAGCGPGTLTTE